MNKEAIKTFLEGVEKKPVEIIDVRPMEKVFEEWCDDNNISGYAAEYLDLNKVFPELLYGENEKKAISIEGDDIDEVDQLEEYINDEYFIVSYKIL